MPAISASAPGKTILFGEHAVVYSRPAIAVPVQQIQTRVVILATPGAGSGEVLIEAPGTGLHSRLSELPSDHPLAQAILSTAAALGVKILPAFHLRVTSTIPIAAGLGSGAAVSVAVIRAVAEFFGRTLPLNEISALAYEIEKHYHGSPSGIDNTVITYAKPIFFVRGKPFQVLSLASPITLVIADTGVKSLTSAVVGDVRARWQQNPAEYERRFDEIAEITNNARRLLENGPINALGPLMIANHRQLQAIGVSCPELDQLITAGLDAGALGAKLSGGGRGGNMIALVTPESADGVATALTQAGAVRVITAHIPAAHPIGESPC